MTGTVTRAYQAVMGTLAGDYPWGRNATAARQGIALVQTHRLSGGPKYRRYALGNLPNMDDSHRRGVLVYFHQNGHLLERPAGVPGAARWQHRRAISRGGHGARQALLIEMVVLSEIMHTKQIFVVMGVSGSGKTTVGRLLAKQLGRSFHDADDFHSAANVARMQSGIPLTDDDRQGWLTRLAAGIREWSGAGGAVLACSALKETYRQQLQAAAAQPLAWVFLDGPEELVRERLHSRQGHYMSPALLASQFAALERPTYGLHLPIDAEPSHLVSRITARPVAELFHTAGQL